MNRTCRALLRMVLFWTFMWIAGVSFFIKMGITGYILIAGAMMNLKNSVLHQ